jgi:hypothetical protein
VWGAVFFCPCMFRETQNHLQDMGRLRDAVKNVATSHPTIDEFNALARRVTDIENASTDTAVGPLVYDYVRDKLTSENAFVTPSTMQSTLTTTKQAILAQTQSNNATNMFPTHCIAAINTNNARGGAQQDVPFLSSDKWSAPPACWLNPKNADEILWGVTCPVDARCLQDPQTTSSAPPPPPASR